MPNMRRVPLSFCLFINIYRHTGFKFHCEFDLVHGDFLLSPFLQRRFWVIHILNFCNFIFKLLIFNCYKYFVTSLKFTYCNIFDGNNFLYIFNKKYIRYNELIMCYLQTFLLDSSIQKPLPSTSDNFSHNASIPCSSL